MIKNVEACKQLSKITRTSLGPNGASLSPSKIFKKTKPRQAPTGGQLLDVSFPIDDANRGRLSLKPNAKILTFVPLPRHPNPQA